MSSTGPTFSTSQPNHLPLSFDSACVVKRYRWLYMGGVNGPFLPIILVDINMLFHLRDFFSCVDFIVINAGSGMPLSLMTIT